MVILKWRMKGSVLVSRDQFREGRPNLPSVLDASQRRARETAAGLYRGPALAAQRTVLGFVLGDGQVQQSLGLDAEFKRATAAIDQSPSGYGSPTSLFDDLHGFLG